MAIDITAKLLASGDKYRKELLALPIASLDEYTKYMTLRPGVRGKESVGVIGSGAELRPYQSAKGATDSTTLGLRELETFMGDIVEEFDPFVLSSTVYGNAVSTSPDKFDIVKAAAMEMAKTTGNKLRQNLFKAVRKANGQKTIDLFNGFATIAQAEITAGTISAAAKNLFVAGQITAVNVVDKIKEAYRALSEELREEKTYLFLPYEIYDKYNDAYIAEVGSVSYNENFTQTYVLGSDRKCQLVPISAMAGSGQMIFSTKANMLVGCDQMGDAEKVEIRRCDN
ncbi:MAG: hypothetical protein RR551_08000, partial [Mucinivorans sp.]